MTQGENSYRQDVFLQDLCQQKDRQQQRIWAEHQQMQLSFLQNRGLTASSTVLDLGCGPMRLGSALILSSKMVGITDKTSMPARLPLVRRFFVSRHFEQAPYSLFASDQLISAWLIGPCRSLSPPCSATSHLIRYSWPPTGTDRTSSIWCVLLHVLRFELGANGSIPIRATSGDANLSPIPIRIHTTTLCLF